ncbi:myo-inositol 2-dehydrogenase [Kwoniella heveanensis CBS 569]|nr:myo-inositol 2-dehydrogenase [Kwoniella heveanensis CBS 569]
MSLQRKLKYAVLGIGRMGQRHALNVAFKSPRSELVAVCDPRASSLEWSEKALPAEIGRFADADKCLRDSGADAVLIASETGQHAPLTIASVKAGKHVLLEKPISIDLDTSRQVVNEVSQYPDLKVMVGFSRRFDESNREIKRMIDAGRLGQPHLVKSATNDQYDPSGFFVSYAAASGGIFVDCAIHDIDLARWFLLPSPANLTASSAVPTLNSTTTAKKEVKRVFALGHNARHPELEKDGDVDNGIGIVEFENGGTLVVHVNRTMMHGHDCFTEVFGTESKVVVNGNPQLNRVEIRDAYGVRTESTPTYYERFKEAFVTEVNEFTEVVLDNKPLPVTAVDALEASKIAAALTHSFRTGQPVHFDDQNEPIMV